MAKKKTETPAQEALRAIAPKLVDIADELGMTYNGVRSWSVGRTEPSAENRERLAHLIDKRITTLRRARGRLQAD